MLKVLVMLQIAAHTAQAAVVDRSRFRRDERGSVTMEHVLWAVAVIGIVGIVVLAVTNYVTAQSAKIK